MLEASDGTTVELDTVQAAREVGRRNTRPTGKGPHMEKRYYSAQSLDRAIQEFEREHEMTTEDLYAAYSSGEKVEGIPYFTQHVWASFYEDILRLTDGTGVERKPIMDRVGRALVCT
jgi:hypothetical protein